MSDPKAGPVGRAEKAAVQTFDTENPSKEAQDGGSAHNLAVLPNWWCATSFVNPTGLLSRLPNPPEAQPASGSMPQGTAPPFPRGLPWLPAGASGMPTAAAGAAAGSSSSPSRRDSREGLRQKLAGPALQTYLGKDLLPLTPHIGLPASSAGAGTDALPALPGLVGNTEGRWPGAAAVAGVAEAAQLLGPAGQALDLGLGAQGAAGGADEPGQLRAKQSQAPGEGEQVAGRSSGRQGGSGGEQGALQQREQRHSGSGGSGKKQRDTEASAADVWGATEERRGRPRGSGDWSVHGGGAGGRERGEGPEQAQEQGTSGQEGATRGSAQRLAEGADGGSAQGQVLAKHDGRQASASAEVEVRRLLVQGSAVAAPPGGKRDGQPGGVAAVFVAGGSSSAAAGHAGPIVPPPSLEELTWQNKLLEEQVEKLKEADRIAGNRILELQALVQRMEAGERARRETPRSDGGGDGWVQPQLQRMENQVVVLTGRVLQLQQKSAAAQRQAAALQAELDRWRHGGGTVAGGSLAAVDLVGLRAEGGGGGLSLVGTAGAARVGGPSSGPQGGEGMTGSRELHPAAMATLAAVQQLQGALQVMRKAAGGRGQFATVPRGALEAKEEQVEEEDEGEEVAGRGGVQAGGLPASVLVGLEQRLEELAERLQALLLLLPDAGEGGRVRKRADSGDTGRNSRPRTK